nr:hypothetical protein [uncultured Mediterranean phage uvMED]
MDNKKQYVNGMIIKEKTFDNGGTQLKLSVKTADLIEQLNALNDEGWVNLIIARRQTPSDTGVTHYVYVDTWKPTKRAAKAVEVGNSSEDDLPF